MQILKTKDNKYFTRVEVGPWYAAMPVEVKECGAPCHRWGWKKIPISKWEQVLAFLKWSYDETKSEAMIHGFYHEELGWEFMPLPQEGHTGMSVKLLEDHPLRIPTFQRLGEGWDIKCTVHHHCASAAFQSGGDRADEKSKEGLHITIGDLDKKTYSIHGRATPPHHLKAEMTGVYATDWFEAPDDVQESAMKLFPNDKNRREELLSDYIDAKLVEPADVLFPDWWKENVIKVERPVQTYSGNSWTPTHYQGNGSSCVSQHRGYNGSAFYMRKYMRDGLEKICASFQMTAGELLETIDLCLNESPIIELLHEMHENEFSLKETADLLDAMALEAREKIFSDPEATIITEDDINLYQ